MSWFSIHTALFLLFFGPTLVLSKPEPRSSCAEHFLNGQFRTRVLPIKYGSNVFDVECNMPDDVDVLSSVHVETIVRNALEKPFNLMNEKRTVGYQISNWELLGSIIRDQKCEQYLNIDWAPLSVDGSIQSFDVESVTGKRVKFVRDVVNGWLGLREELTLNLATNLRLTLTHEGPAGIVHLIPTGNSSFTAKLSSTPLRCRQPVIRNLKCEFELNSAQDRISVATPSAETLSFSFRTDKPDSALLRLIGYNNAGLDVRLKEGYLITVGRENPYPIRLLADGNYHGIKLNFKSKSLRIDGQFPDISFDLPYMKTGIKEVQILVNGSVTAIRFDDEKWQCKSSKFLTVVSNGAILRRICPSTEASYCQCKAPSSVVSSNRYASPSELKCNATDADEGFVLERGISQLCFFYFDSPRISQSVSVVFKSDAQSGLIMFGQHEDAGSSFERFQVSYIGDIVEAGACLLDGDNQWSCRSCRITHLGGFATNNWIRVSFFNSTRYTYLTVDDQICRLKNSDDFKPHQFYKSDKKSKPFLFVGGSFNTENVEMRLVKSEFSNLFHEPSLVKPLSIRGVVGEIRIDGNVINLSKQFEKQAHHILVNPTQKNELFSMTRGGSANCDYDCNGFPCRVQRNKPVCDCAAKYGLYTQDNMCGTSDTPSPSHALWLNSSLPISLRKKVDPLLRYVTKVWMLVRLPQIAKTPAKFIDFWRFQIYVADYGKTVVVASDLFEVREEFYIESNDERLHLISIELAPSVSQSQHMWKIRVDSSARTLVTDRNLKDPFDVTILTVQNDTSPQSFGGCIEGFYVAMSSEYRDEDGPRIVNVLREITNEDKVASSAHLQMHHGQSCGIYDPNFFEYSSSPFGIVGDYDPYGEMQSIQGGFPWITLFFAAFVLLLVISLCVYYILDRAGKRTYVLEKRNAGFDEARPLYTGSLQNSSPDAKAFVNSKDQQSPTQSNEEPYHNTVVTIQQPTPAQAVIASKDNF